MMFNKKVFHEWWLCSVALTALVLLFATLPGAIGTRVKLGSSGEPQSAQVYNNFRMLYANPYLYYLKSAGLLNQSEVSEYFMEDRRGPDGHFMKGTFDFNSSELLRKVISLKWFVYLEERVSLQVYDDQLERDSAAGPQVNQKLCGLHLDYMLHLRNKHHVNYANSSEYSIFVIMSTFGIPDQGIETGNVIFPGSYRSCSKASLNVMRKELIKVDKQAAEEYFKNRLSIVAKSTQASANWFLKTLKTILTYLGPFFGFPIDNKRVDLDKHAGDMHALPMRYCLMALRWPSLSNSTYSKRSVVVRSAVCLPETCDSNSLRHHGSKIKKLVGFKMTDYFSGYYIDELYCLPDKNSPIRNPFHYTSTTLFIAFNVLWFTLTLVATSMKLMKGSRRRQDKTKTSANLISENRSSERNWWMYLSSWCLSKNLSDFWSAKRSRLEETTSDKTISQNGIKGNKVDLDPLEGFKVISSIAVITSHACMVFGGAIWNTSVTNDMVTKSWLAMINTVCPAVVDNFFVATGIVMARILFQTPKKVLMVPSFWIKFVLYRYMRIVPLYLLIHWFLKSSFRFTGSGPFWDYGTSHTAWSKMCQNESFWTVIFPSANFKSPSATCNGVGWYLANDIQFSLITPIFIILYLKKPILGHLAIFSTATLMIANHVRYYLINKFDYRGLIDGSVMTLSVVTDDATDGYVNPQYRCPSYLIGLAAGYLLVEYERGAIRKWPKWFITFGKAFFYFVLYLLCFSPYITSILPYDNMPLIKLTAAFFSGTIHSLTSVAAAFFLLLLCTGQMPAWAHLYSKPAFRPLANISLSTLLVHIPILFYHSQAMTSLPELSDYYFVTSTFLVCVESFLVAIAVHVLYELPLRKFLVKLMIGLFSNADSKSKSKSNGPQFLANKSKLS